MAYLNKYYYRSIVLYHSAVHVFKLVFSDLQHKPPLEVNDLFEDIKDGVKLLALLEVLSGQRLVSCIA